MQDKKILVLGSINADHVMLVEQFPRPGETVAGSSYSIFAGGKGANQAVACSRLGGRTSLIANVGDDEVGRGMVEQFKKNGVDTSLVEKLENEKTGIALILVDEQAENVIGIYSGANAAISPEKIKSHEDSIEQSDYLLTQLEIPLESIITAASLGCKHQTKVILDPAPAHELSEQLLSCIDIITPNQTEAEVLTGINVKDAESAASAASILHSRGVNTVIITMGSNGAYLSSPDESCLIPGKEVTPLDTTAAGDTFNGALLAGLSKGMAMTDAIRFANQSAAIAVTRIGAQTSIPYLSEVGEIDQERALAPMLVTQQ